MIVKENSKTIPELIDPKTCPWNGQRKNRERIMLLFVHSAAHLLVDAVCAAALFGPLKGQEDLTALILLYNTLAFSTQCLVGLAADRIGKHRISAAAAMLCVAAGFFLPLPALLRVMLIGLGNSVFHVAAGTETMINSGGKAAPLGVFVAPGAIGIAVGTLFPALGPVLAGLLILAAAASLLVKAPVQPAVKRPGAAPRSPLAAVLLLTAAVSVRAVGGASVSFPWQTGPLLILLATGCVFAGKFAGGFLCDRVGAGWAAWLSVPLAAVLITFCETWMAPSLLGQFALNLTMPITLWLLYCAMPKNPGFAFGMAASALWPGTLLGKLIHLSGPSRWWILLLCFLFGLFAILISLPKNSTGRGLARSRSES